MYFCFPVILAWWQTTSTGGSQTRAKWKAWHGSSLEWNSFEFCTTLCFCISVFLYLSLDGKQHQLTDLKLEPSENLKNMKFQQRGICASLKLCIFPICWKIDFPPSIDIPDLLKLYYDPISHFMAFLLFPDTKRSLNCVLYTGNDPKKSRISYLGK